MSIDYNQLPSPCFVLDESRLKQNLQLINQVAANAGISIILAFKGFAMWSVFDLVKQYLGGASASSLNEALLCVEHMNCKAHMYAPAYQTKEFENILECSSHITFNSLTQYEKFKSQVHSHPNPISVGIRVNPQYSDVSTELYNPASPYSRLGMGPEHLVEGLPEGIEGLHFHVLCESDSYSLEKVLASFEAKFGHLLNDVKWVNMGGGHLMTRDGYEIEHLISLIKNFKEKHDVEVILEPGSAIAWETGVLVSTVLDIVENHGKKTAILDTSFTCHMPDCLEMPYTPKVRDTRENGAYEYSLGGLSCLAGDYIDDFRFDRPLSVGDRIIFEDMIHYTMVKTTTFNGVGLPSIGVLKEDHTFQLVRQFGYGDFAGRLS